jgi:hypothetical protein
LSYVSCSPAGGGSVPGLVEMEVATFRFLSMLTTTR